jgi:hypothetical protein
VVKAKGMLARVMVKVVCRWSWRSHRINNRMEAALGGGLGKWVGSIAKDMMRSMVV